MNIGNNIHAAHEIFASRCEYIHMAHESFETHGTAYALRRGMNVRYSKSRASQPGF